MFSTLRNRFGIPGVISVLALVFAMIGGAYAASNSGDGKGATASAKKAAKGPRGPRGATGPAGAAGPAGPAGAKGDTGAAGANGTNGANGKDGAAGKGGQSVTTAVEPPEGECGEQEGVELKSASGIDYVCNGANGSQGAKGAQGEPWTAGGTLPKDSTQTGTWTINASPDDEFTTFSLEGTVATSISFPIPLASSATPHFINGGDPVPAECENPKHDGAASVANPEASSDHLCVYDGPVSSSALKFFGLLDPGLTSFTDTGLSGAIAVFENESSGAVLGEGTWAVTG